MGLVHFLGWAEPLCLFDLFDELRPAR